MLITTSRRYSSLGGVCALIVLSYCIYFSRVTQLAKNLVWYCYVICICMLSFVSLSRSLKFEKQPFLPFKAGNFIYSGFNLPLYVHLILYSLTPFLLPPPRRLRFCLGLSACWFVCLSVCRRNSTTCYEYSWHFNPLECRGNYSATSNNMNFVWPLMSGLLHLVQQGEDWAGPQPAQAPPRCTKCNSPPINGQCTNHRIAV